MSTAVKLKEAITEYRKAHTELDERLKKAEEKIAQTRQEQKVTQAPQQ